MKNIFLSLLLLAVLSGSAIAQQKRDHKSPHGHKHRHGMMMKALNLTPEQQKQMKVSHDAFKKQMEELNKNENITLREFRDKKYALRKEQKAKWMALLTPEQKNRITRMKAEHKARKDEQFANHLEHMKTKIGLTDEQVAKLKAQRESMHVRLNAIRENDKLTRSEKKDQLVVLKAEAKEQHKKIFTEEQLKQIEKLKQQHMDGPPSDKAMKPTE